MGTENFVAGFRSEGGTECVGVEGEFGWFFVQESLEQRGCYPWFEYHPSADVSAGD